MRAGACAPGARGKLVGEFSAPAQVCHHKPSVYPFGSSGLTGSWPFDRNPAVRCPALPSRRRVGRWVRDV